MIAENPDSGDCIETLGTLIGFDTTSRYSNLELIEQVRQALDKIGIASRLTYNDERTKANLWATIGPQDRGGIVLSGHTDVVPVGGQDWSSDPFAMEERGGRLFGRGTSDMKGFIACCLANAKRMQDADLRTPLHFAFSYDEEVGCIGVGGLIDDVQANLPLPKAVIVGEPTMMEIVGGGKGSRGFLTEVHGLGGHSSMPGLGVNSIFVASKIVVFLQDLQERLIRDCDPNNGFDPPYTTIDCGLIDGGIAPNVIPEACTISWGFRNVPADDLDQLTQEVFDYISGELEPAMRKVSAEAHVSHDRVFELPPLRPDETSNAETILRHLTGLNQSDRVAYGTEAGHFQVAGMPGAIFGPGSILQAHLPDEFIDVSQMAACHDFMGELIAWASENELS